MHSRELIYQLARIRQPRKFLEENPDILERARDHATKEDLAAMEALSFEGDYYGVAQVVDGLLLADDREDVLEKAYDLMRNAMLLRTYAALDEAGKGNIDELWEVRKIYRHYRETLESYSGKFDPYPRFAGLMDSWDWRAFRDAFNRHAFERLRQYGLENPDRNFLWRFARAFNLTRSFRGVKDYRRWLEQLQYERL